MNEKTLSRLKVFSNRSLKCVRFVKNVQSTEHFEVTKSPASKLLSTEKCCIKPKVRIEHSFIHCNKLSDFVTLCYIECYAIYSLKPRFVTM